MLLCINNVRTIWGKQTYSEIDGFPQKARNADRQKNTESLIDELFFSAQQQSFICSNALLTFSKRKPATAFILC